MPPAEPIGRLEGEFTTWEDLLDEATGSSGSGSGEARRVRLASELVDASLDERLFVNDWRARVRLVCYILYCFQRQS